MNLRGMKDGSWINTRRVKDISGFSSRGYFIIHQNSKFTTPKMKILFQLLLFITKHFKCKTHGLQIVSFMNSFLDCKRVATLFL